MGGGLLNLLSYGNQNIIINGNPQKSFFKATYKKYTNFGIQKFSVGQIGSGSQLQEHDDHFPKTFSFNIPKNGDLLLDTFFSIKMPYIWSPVWVEPSNAKSYPGAYREYNLGIDASRNIAWPNNVTPRQPQNDISGNDGAYCIWLEQGYLDASGSTSTDPNKYNNDLAFAVQIPYCQPFEFKWIEDLGCQLLKKVTVTIGEHIIQEFSGQYLRNMVKRDFPKEKQELFDEMTGNVPEMNNPAYAFKRNGYYPNSLFSSETVAGIKKPNGDQIGYQWALYNNKKELLDIVNENNQTVIRNESNLLSNLEPSINKRQLVIPLNLWYMLSSSNAFPYLCMNDTNTLKITIECRPIRELFVVRDVRNYLSTYFQNSYNSNNVNNEGFAFSDISSNSPKIIINNENIPSNFLKPNETFSIDDISFSSTQTTLFDLINSSGSAFNYYLPYKEPNYVSTNLGNKDDPLYQLYMFTTQFASLNQSYVQEAAMKTTLSSNINSKLKKISNWNAEPQLICSFAFLDEDEQLVFKSKAQKYIFKGVHEDNESIYIKSQKSIYRFQSNYLVSNWTWYFQRSDVNLRNEWSNYTNWDYKNKKNFPLQPLYYSKAKGPPLSENYKLSTLKPPQNDISYGTIMQDTAFSLAEPNLIPNPIITNYLSAGTPPPPLNQPTINNPTIPIQTRYLSDFSYNSQQVLTPLRTKPNSLGEYQFQQFGSRYVGKGMLRQLPYFPYVFTKDISGVRPYITGLRQNQNDRIIQKEWAITLDGDYRETYLNSNYFNKTECYLRTNGGFTEGLYFYNFGLNTNPFINQPDGALNTSKFFHIKFDFKTITPPELKNINTQLMPIVTSLNLGGGAVPFAYNKYNWELYRYNYILNIFTEYYQVLTIENGLATLTFKQ
tara:strand:+ start:1148 stop:3814 length:2667 start_codon:yes stop_codon:yes gene_type:complete